MDYINKTLKTAWFGIISNRVLLGIMTLIFVIILPGLEVVFHGADNAGTARAYGIAIAYFGGIIIPFAMFSYVQNRRECDFYNSMPVKRSQYFLGYFIAGFGIFLAPCLLMFLLHFFFCGEIVLFDYFVQSIAVFTVNYCFMILSVMFSGSILSSIVTFLLINAILPVAVTTTTALAGLDASCYYMLFEEKLFMLTPLSSGFFAAAIEDYHPEMLNIVMWQLLAAAFAAVIAFFLHRLRRSESTTALAFPKLRWLYQYLVMLTAALAVGSVMSVVMLNSSFDFDYYYHLEKRPILQMVDGQYLAMFVFFTVAAVLITFVLTNIIVERSGGAAFKGIQHFFIFLAGYGVIFVLLLPMAMSNLPKYIVPFEPDMAVVEMLQYHKLPPEEAEKVKRGESNDKLRYTYGANLDEIFVSDPSPITYCTVDREKLKKLCAIMSNGGDDNCRFDHQLVYLSPIFKGHEDLESYADIRILLYKHKWNYDVSSVTENSESYQIDDSHIVSRSYDTDGFTFAISDFIKMTDFELKNWEATRFMHYFDWE